MLTDRVVPFRVMKTFNLKSSGAKEIPLWKVGSITGEFIAIVFCPRVKWDNTCNMYLEVMLPEGERGLCLG